MTTAQQFAELVTAHAIKAGYDLSSPRSGGRTALADDTGMSLATVSRMLGGKTLPDPYSLQALADAIDAPVALLLEASGVIGPGVLTGDHCAKPTLLMVKQAAARLGITKPLHVKLLEAITATLLADQEAAR